MSLHGAAAAGGREVPEFSLFDKISLEEYSNYKDQFKNKAWDFKEESEKYCILDCISLYQILSKFNQLIFNSFKINITKYPTLSSLAFGIFRTHFLVKKEDIERDSKGNLIPTRSKIHMLPFPAYGRGEARQWDNI